MMKNLLLTLFTVLLASASFSQHDLSIELRSPLAGTTQGGTDSQMEITIKNNGTTTISDTNTLLLAVTYETSLYSFFNFTSNAYSILTLTSALAPGDTLHETSPLITYNNYPTAVTMTNVCTVGYVRYNTDTDSSNNIACYTWNVSLAGTDEIAKKENEVKISANAGLVNMTSVNDNNYSYSVYSITGQVVSQGNFVNNKQVDLTGVAKGIYAVVVTNGTEKITKKISIQ
jgi:hypothetical protein